MTDSAIQELMTKLQDMNKTKEELFMDKAEKAGKAFGEAIGLLIVTLGVVTMVWAILNFIFVIQIAWLKILGALVLFNLFKNIVVKPLLNK
jgi:tetrahydromethanopterin S-methyltransferase subunit G